VALLAILVVFAIQRLTHWVHVKDLPAWLLSYFDQTSHFLSKHKSLKISIYIKTLLFLLPIPLVAGILSLWLASISTLSAFCFNAIVFWYCLGDSRFKRRFKVQSVDDLCISAYAEVFAVFFWFVILGALGAGFYYLTHTLIVYLNNKKEKPVHLLHASQKIRATLDWVPIRLLGLSFALVGHFFIAASDWWHHLKGGLPQSQSLIIEYVEKATAFQGKNLNEKKEHVLFLIERALWLWLIVFSVIMITLWID
jgi:AmpE protein